jgi:hypothetical protein
VADASGREVNQTLTRVERPLRTRLRRRRTARRRGSSSAGPRYIRGARPVHHASSSSRSSGPWRLAAPTGANRPGPASAAVPTDAGDASAHSAQAERPSDFRGSMTITDAGPVYGPELEGFTYPYPVHQYDFVSQGTPLRMAYMDHGGRHHHRCRRSRRQLVGVVRLGKHVLRVEDVEVPPSVEERDKERTSVPTGLLAPKRRPTICTSRLSERVGRAMNTVRVWGASKPSVSISTFTRTWGPFLT